MGEHAPRLCSPQIVRRARAVRSAQIVRRAQIVAALKPNRQVPWCFLIFLGETLYYTIYILF